MYDESNQPAKKRPIINRLRTVCAWITGVLLLMCGVGVRVFPMTATIRALLLATLLSCLITGFVAVVSGLKRRSAAVWPMVFFLALLIVWSVMGNKPPNIEALRKVYFKRLSALVGTPYQIDGETNLGVDSAGLARAALWHAMVREGVKEFNPRLLGRDLWNFWWRDMDAADIYRGKYGYARSIGFVDKLAGFDTEHLKIGDMAVADGQHVMIYYGKEKWIEANPIDGKVVINKAPAKSKRKWFNEPVRLIRWRIFEEK